MNTGAKHLIIQTNPKSARATRLVIPSTRPSMAERLQTLLPGPPKGKWRIVVLAVLGVTSVAFCGLGYLLTSFALVHNGSKSLPHNAYAMVTYPKIMAQGAYVAFDPPAHFDRGNPFIKEVIGLPGDVIEHRDGFVCVNDRCLKPQGDKDPFIAKTPMGVIGKGHYFVAGHTDDSLDSRYASLGLITKDRVRAVGIPLANFPHWKEWLAWLKG